jgi:hypothetical protein
MNGQSFPFLVDLDRTARAAALDGDLAKNPGR